MRVVIYVPSRGARRWARVCQADAERRGDEVVSVVVGAWSGAVSMLESGRADQIVVGRWAHVPPDALSWLRVVFGRP